MDWARTCVRATVALAIVAGSTRSAAPDTVEYPNRWPAPVASEQPKWPAAARYVCRGMVILQVEIDTAGIVRSARVSQRRPDCPDSLLASAIDSAAVRAVWRWRFAPAEPQDRTGTAVAAIPLRIPDPPAEGRVVVGSVRDSVSGLPRPQSDILGPDGGRLGGTDDTGWFVLSGAATEASKLRAHVFCRAGGFRRVRLWKRRGDELTLYVWKSTCADDTR